MMLVIWRIYIYMLQEFILKKKFKFFPPFFLLLSLYIFIPIPFNSEFFNFLIFNFLFIFFFFDIYIHPFL